MADTANSPKSVSLSISSPLQAHSAEIASSASTFVTSTPTETLHSCGGTKLSSRYGIRGLRDYGDGVDGAPSDA
jgi:hypothetical protein